jgi:MFS transporter, OFA family, oxalate/formate antiporter
VVDQLEKPAASDESDDASEGRRGLRGIYFGYWLVGAAFIAQFISVGAQNYVFGAFIAPMTQEFDWTRTEMTAARTIGQTMMAFTGLFIGTLVDRHGGKWLMRVGIVVMTASMFMLAEVQTLWQWWLLNGIILTAGSAMIGNLVVNVTIAKWFVEQRGRVIGIASMGVSFAGIVITPFSAYLVEAVGWRDAWRILAVLAAMVIVPLSFMMRRAPEDHGLHPDGKTNAQIAQGAGRMAAADLASSLTRGQALRTSAFYIVSVSFGLGVISIGTMLIHTIPFMQDAGYSAEFAAFMITVTSVPALLLKPVWGYFIDKADVQKISLIGFLVNAVGLVTIVVSVEMASVPLIFLGFFFLGCGWSGFIPLQEVVWATFFGRRYLGAVRSAGLPFALGISATAPLATAFYFDNIGDYNGAFLGIAALSILGGALLAIARRPVRVEREG